MKKRLLSLKHLSIFLFTMGLFVVSCSEDDNVPFATPSEDLVAEFTASAAYLDLTTTNQSRNAVSYAWDFGDGVGTSTDENPTYTYPDSGTYTIELTATAQDGSTDTYSIAMAVDRFIVTPSASFSSSVDLLEVAFTNTSTDGVSYAWDFGDGTGTSTDENPTYTYATEGTYTVSLTVTSSTGDSVTYTDEVNPVAPVPPVANFTFESAGTDATFTDATEVNDGENITYAWDFGDGTGTSTDQSPTYTYAAPGDYDVMLTVTFDDIDGTTTSSSTQTITISNLVAPVASFSFDNNDLTTTFVNDTEVNDGMNITYAWDFGDGNTSTDQSPMHTFADYGLQTVELTVTFDDILGETQSIVEQSTFLVASPNLVMNGDFDYFTNTTGDNADSWDMTPNSTVKNNNGDTVPSPFSPIWKNNDLNSYIDATYCTNEQPGSTSDGTFIDGVKTRGGKLSNNCRRLYQRVLVQAGVPHTFSIDTRAEAEGINTEIFMLNTEITTEDGIESFSDMTVEILPATHYNPSKGDADTNTFTNTSFTFTPTTDQVIIYVRALAAVDGSNEVFIDNIVMTAQ